MRLNNVDWFVSIGVWFICDSSYQFRVLFLSLLFVLLAVGILSDINLTVWYGGHVYRLILKIGPFFFATASKAESRIYFAVLSYITSRTGVEAVQVKPVDLLFMAALCNRGAIIFLPCDFYLLSIFLSFLFLA